MSKAKGGLPEKGKSSLSWPPIAKSLANKQYIRHAGCSA